MSGPCCDSCRWFNRGLLAIQEGNQFGECADPTKRIYYKHGMPDNSAPEVSTQMTCSNHTPEDTKP